MDLSRGHKVTVTSQPAHVLGAAGWVVGKTFGVARGVYSVRLLWMCARVEFLFVFAFFDAVGCVLSAM